MVAHAVAQRLEHGSGEVWSTEHVCTLCAIRHRDATTPWPGPTPAMDAPGALFSNGASMLLAALPGYVGCEVLAVSNWFLHRDDPRSAGLQRWARPGWDLDDPDYTAQRQALWHGSSITWLGYPFTAPASSCGG